MTRYEYGLRRDDVDGERTPRGRVSDLDEEDAGVGEEGGGKERREDMVGIIYTMEWLRDGRPARETCESRWGKEAGWANGPGLGTSEARKWTRCNK